MNITRRALLATVAATFAAGSGFEALAQDAWPSRIVRLVSPYGAGGASDISLRILAEQLGRRLNQQFIVENKPGGGTRVANELVARAAPDGYTVLYAAAPYATAEALFGKLGYERKDLQPVAMAVMAPLFLVVNAQAPYKTLAEFIAYGKSKPDGLTLGSPGAGSQPHLAAELLASRLDATLTAISTALPHIQSGQLRVLGVASATRSPIYPDAPTLSEQGLPNVVASGWYGFMAPAATPRPIVERLQEEIVGVLDDPDVKQKLQVQGLDARPGTAAEFGKFIDDETSKWGKLIRDAGLKGD